jgi:hypothetical protein
VPVLDAVGGKGVYWLAPLWNGRQTERRLSTVAHDR